MGIKNYKNDHKVGKIDTTFLTEWLPVSWTSSSYTPF